MKRIFIQKLLASALVLPLLASAQGTFVYDQQSSDESRGGNSGITIQNAQPTAQSFTPLLNEVGFVRLELFDQNSNNGLGATLYVNLRSNSITGPILSSTPMITLPDNFGVAGNGFVNFIFTDPVKVQPGVTYFLQPVVESGDFWWVHGGIFNYARGTAYGFGQSSFPVDYWFREGIVVPEPSTGLLLLLGAAALTLRWIRSR